jgi:acyl-CoA thioester hydrolase
MKKKRVGYFECGTEDPAPLCVATKCRVAFSEVDLMGIAWHGRYASFFEKASTELCRAAGLSFRDLHEANLRAPIVRLHVDYARPLLLDEEIVVEARLIWNAAARLNIEYVIRKPDRSVAATGYTIQLFTDAASGQLLMASPDLLIRRRREWQERAAAPT